MGLMDELIVEGEEFFIKVDGINKKVKVKPIGEPAVLRWPKNRPDDVKSILWLRVISSNVNAYAISKYASLFEATMDTYAVQYYRIKNK